MGQFLAIAAILAVWLWGLKQLRSEPFDNPMSDFTEQDRACPFGCGCMGGAAAGLPFQHRGVGNRGRLNHRRPSNLDWDQDYA